MSWTFWKNWISWISRSSASKRWRAVTTSEEEQAEEERNILNGLNFARKVIATQECDFLVLDEILGLLDKHIATVDMVVGLLKQKDESMHLILTGNRVDPGILDYVDSVTTITTLGREQNS